jgi:hypothetical protein
MMARMTLKGVGEHESNLSGVSSTGQSLSWNDQPSGQCRHGKVDFPDRCRGGVVAT